MARYGLCGTQSSGKSTLINELAKLPEFKDYYIATERSKYLRDMGVKLNTDSTINGQFAFASERSLELMNENLLTDRSIYDVCSYTLSAESIDWYDKRRLVEAFVTLVDQYDVIFYVSPEGVEIENNGVRETNSEYRNKIDYTIRELLAEYPPKQLFTLKGPVEDRINQVKSCLFS